MESIDNICSHIDEKYYEIMKNNVDELLEEYGLTVDDLKAERYVTYAMVDRIFDGSTRIKSDTN